MRTQITHIFAHDGPFVSVYLDARSNQPQAQHHLEARWKSTRSALSAEGATNDDLAAVDVAIQQCSHSGGAALAVVAAHGRVLLAEHLQEPPVRDSWRLGQLPWVGPLVESYQRALPHLTVVADRTGAEITGFDTTGSEVSLAVVASANQDVERVQAGGAGGWSQRRYDRHQVKTWEENAGEVAEKLVGLVEQTGAQVIGIRGDVHAVRLIRKALPRAVNAIVRDLGDHGIHGDPTRLVDTAIAEATVAVIAEFDEERGQQDRAADGPAPTIEALQSARVQTLLVHDDPADERMAWFGPEAVHVALDAATLEAMGVEHPSEGRLIDACVRAAVLTSAEVRVVPSTVVDAGVGAVLRYA